jgi:microcystin-dependent protein
MADPFLAEIRIFPFNFAPKGWALCDGGLMPISQNTALFALLGTIYGGDGKSTFALPNLQGSAPMHPGQGQGLSLRDLGEEGGTEQVTLLESEMPSHTHQMIGDSGVGSSNDPAGNLPARPFGGGDLYGAPGPGTQLAMNAIAPAGTSLHHNNMMPYLTLHFCIALQGIFPMRW